MSKVEAKTHVLEKKYPRAVQEARGFGLDPITVPENVLAQLQSKIVRVSSRGKRS